MNKLFFLLSAFTLLCSMANAQSNRFDKERFAENGDTLNYRFLSPDYDTVRKYPLVIFLHGSGERGSDNEAQLKWGVMNFATDESMSMHPAFIIAPQCPRNSQWASYENEPGTFSVPMKVKPTKPMQLLIDLIRQAVAKFPVDTNRIYITGLSMGGFGTYDLIERYPNLFAAAVPVCGGGDITKAKEIKHIPMWIFHGAEDAAVDPDFSVNMVSALIKAGGHPGFTLYPETGHFSWNGAYADKRMMDWLFRQHK